MFANVSRPTFRVTLGLALAVLGTGLLGCTAGVKQTPAGTGGANGPGTAGVTGAGGINIIGTAGTTGATGTGGTLPVPPGCGDGINNQGGIEQCDDGNTLAGDGCNGACRIEPNWNCPSAGRCTRNNTCGDGAINAGEVCDDRNTADGDGCNATCTVQDPAYTCIPGSMCVRSSICGNRRVEPGENCDDGNATSSDGCSRECQVEGGYVCPTPGMPCMPAPRCGDGIVQVTRGEVCDDGNITEGDGCSSDCRVKGASCSCVPGMKCVCPEVRCGNGTIEGNERCDDGNANSGDGCSSTCTIERGYVCPLVKAPCVPDCGDGILTGNEPCDPGIATERMACSDQCRWNPGWACTGNPVTECHRTTCGDNRKEGSEGCDDGNTAPYDGCSATCVPEPACPSGGTAGACTGKCGDGIVLSGEACDDANNLSGDGCSATCTLESGFMCTRPPLGPYIDVPVVYRDFKYRTPTDFEPSATGQMAIVPGLVNATLDATSGKPARSGVAYTYIASAATFAQWYTDVAGVNHRTNTTLRLYDNGAGGYVNRWGPNGEQWILYTNQAWCDNASCAVAGCQAPPAGQVCVQPCPGWGGAQACYATPNPLDGTPTFFPIDNDNFSPLETRAANLPPPYDPNWNLEVPAVPHNFSFTSEVRYWFPYDSTKTYKLDFMGDDDVWMFVNKRLAVDIGGIHTPQAGSITINAQNAGTFGLQNGNVYEVEVFQAERQTTSSSYKLTLSGFNAGTSACGPICGDLVVTPPEQCDNGTVNNTGGYNKCTPDCKLGPFCGDMMVTDAEQCDNGTNSDAYGAMSGCGPGCKLPARCGDLVVQTEYGEQCDDGTNSGGYGGCTNQCQRGPYCGDGKVTSPQEQCDDGANDGTYGNCGNPMMALPNCQFGPRCGDGIVQDAYGEQCEPMSSNDPNCTIACRLPGVCGDGIVQFASGEQCDDGAVLNDGSYGGCAPGCIWAPHCGDGVRNGPEECDDGVNDNSYGGCSQVCKLAAHCGDGRTDTGYEQCDNGVNNGPNNPCSAVCKLNIDA